MRAGRNLIPICLLCAVMLQALTSGAQPVTQTAAGELHSLFLKSDGSLWAMGFNNFGQLGDGTYNKTNLPEQIVAASNVTAIAAGSGHSLLIKSDGSLWAMGENNYGQLGDGTSNQTNRPEQIVASNVTAIAAGDFHSLFLKSDGSLWAMGYNSSGELGDSTNNNTNQPEEIVGSNVTAIAAGARHSLFLKSDGSLWAMGSNQYGQLGDGAFPFPTNRPEQIVASNVTAIAAGQYHSLFLKSDGSLWSMGLNGSGQLGDGTYNNAIRPEPVVASNVIAIATGAEANCSLFVKSDGSLWGMGDNSFGRLGISAYPSPGSTNRPTEIVGSNVVVFVVVSAGGQQVNGYTINEAWRLDGDAAVTAASAGGGQTLILMSNGSLGALGWDAYGQLGNGIYDQYGATARPQLILAAYNQISSQLMGGTNMQLNFVGVANANYALDWSSSLSPPNWVPQATNPASSFGPLVFTNPPDATTNNFWRIRSVP